MTETRGVCITAVHGTNDRDADWAKPGSRLHRAIELNFSALCQWRDPFNWSGDNRQEDRVTASAELADRLLDSVRTNPDCLQFVIAHSHGGNIALYTALDPRLKGRIDGVITVGTPYFHAIQRNAFTLFRGVAHGLLPAAAIAVFLPFVVADQLRMSGALHPIALLALSLLGLLVAMVGFVALVVWLSRRERASIGKYLAFYNVRRPHSSLDGATPDQAYFRNDPQPIRLAA